MKISLRWATDRHMCDMYTRPELHNFFLCVELQDSEELIMLKETKDIEAWQNAVGMSAHTNQFLNVTIDDISDLPCPEKYSSHDESLREKMAFACELAPTLKGAGSFITKLKYKAEV